MLTAEFLVVIIVVLIMYVNENENIFFISENDWRWMPLIPSPSGLTGKLVWRGYYFDAQWFQLGKYPVRVSYAHFWLEATLSSSPLRCFIRPILRWKLSKKKTFIGQQSVREQNIIRNTSGIASCKCFDIILIWNSFRSPSDRFESFAIYLRIFLAGSIEWHKVVRINISA